MGKNSDVFKVSLGFNGTHIFKTLKWGVCGGALIALIQFPYELYFSADIPNYFLDYFLKIRSKPFLTLFVGIILAPFIEELVFRAWAFRYLLVKFNRVIGYIGSTSLFLLAHWSIKGILLIGITSVILTYIFEKTRLLGASIIAHSLWNATWYAATIYIFNDRVTF